jgi:hypothetical protein
MNSINEFLGGKYANTGGVWFKTIGATISLTMLIQSLSIPFTILIGSLI